MNDHMKRFHSVTLGHREDYSKPVLIEAKKNQTPTVSPYLLDGVQSEQAEIRGFVFDCAEAATNTEGIVSLDPGKGESIEGKSMEGASGMECVVSHGGNYGNDPDYSLNNDETSFQSSVDSAVQDHSIIPDCSQHYIPEIIQINEENTIQEENEDFNSVEYHQFVTHRGMNLNPNLDAESVPITGLKNPLLTYHYQENHTWNTGSVTLIFLVSGLKMIRSLYAKTLMWRPIAKHRYISIKNIL